MYAAKVTGEDRTRAICCVWIFDPALNPPGYMPFAENAALQENDQGKISLQGRGQRNKITARAAMAMAWLAVARDPTS